MIKKSVILLSAMFFALFVTTGCTENDENQKSWFNKEILSINFNKDARFIIIDSSEKYGYIDKTGKVVIKPQYNFAYNFIDGVAKVRVKKNGKYYYGLIDNQGNKILEPEYDDIEPFSEDVAAVISDGKTGYINKKGEFIIWPKFDYGYAFQNGVAKVIMDNRAGFINKKGEYIIYPKFTNALTVGFRGNKAIVISNGKYCLIDKSGEVVKTFDIEEINEFTKNLYEIKNKKGKYGLVDINGKTVLEPKYDGLYAIEENGKFIAFRNEKSQYGVMDKNFKVIIPAKYSSSPKYGENIITITDTDYSNNKTSSYIYDTKGKLIKKFDAAFGYSIFSNGLCTATKDSKTGYIDKTGKIAIPFKFYAANSFQNGLASVAEVNGSKLIFGYIDKAGKYVWKLETKRKKYSYDDGEDSYYASDAEYEYLKYTTNLSKYYTANNIYNYDYNGYYIYDDESAGDDTDSSDNSSSYTGYNSYNSYNDNSYNSGNYYNNSYQSSYEYTEPEKTKDIEEAESNILN